MWTIIFTQKVKPKNKRQLLYRKKPTKNIVLNSNVVNKFLSIYDGSVEQDFILL